MIKKYRIQIELMEIGVKEVEIFTDEIMARERLDALAQSAKTSGLDIEITFDIFEK